MDEFKVLSQKGVPFCAHISISNYDGDNLPLLNHSFIYSGGRDFESAIFTLQIISPIIIFIGILEYRRNASIVSFGQDKDSLHLAHVLVLHLILHVIL